ncbi:MAG: molybdopterin-dependent oxidoreductase [Bdellovibrionaceae bacterium]|nr:molybdopterin-dependent oxidoreductase [Bdellovibrionales bacterium]MCB9085120.1 molybdopterin-dependent oxidoreductase [Pseudobdellovibrionaceae bacterium]
MSLGQNIPHDSARSHVTGESVFIDDRPRHQGELLVLPVGVPAPSGRLKSYDVSSALRVPGIRGFCSAKHLSHNRWGSIVEDQPILVDEEIGYFGEPAVLLVGETHEALDRAGRLVQFDIEQTDPILKLDQAIEQRRFLYTANPFVSGNVDQAFADAAHHLSGVFECGGQDHFYLESQASVAYPQEGGQIEVHASSQHPAETQRVVAEALGLSHHQVVCVVKRMGGAFGGKESQAAPFAAMAALVAKIFQEPARVVLSKDDDMKMTGKRHPFKNHYQVAFDQEGRILGLKAKLYADGGAYLDLSPSILDRALFHIDGAYFLENVHLEGFVCCTNTPSNTAFRGFGGPQGLMTIESICEDIAIFLGSDALEIRRLNCYGVDERNRTHYGQIVTNNILPDLFKSIADKCHYRKRRQEIDQFNQNSVGKVRGLSVTATKFGIAFTSRFLNQGNALVNVHLDGSVQVSTGATEMGQGVNTKIKQIVAHSFGLDPCRVNVMATSTEKNANTSPTAASSGSDINGAAALLACEKILDRLCWLYQNILAGTPISENHECPPFDSKALRRADFEFREGHIVHVPSKKDMKWEELVRLAYRNRLSLNDYAHYKTEGLAFDKAKSKGKAFAYYTTGVAASEVEVDEWTGQVKVLRTDILMDLGRPINPGIDEGQVTGAFVQGMGWVTTECLKTSEKGELLTHSPTTYKIPNVQDVPREFNVELIPSDSNTQNVARSKAVGEPPFLLSASVWTAVKDALRYRHGKNVLPLRSPATPEEILMVHLSASENQ